MTPIYCPSSINRCFSSSCIRASVTDRKMPHEKPYIFFEKCGHLSGSLWKEEPSMVGCVGSRVRR